MKIFDIIGMCFVNLWRRKVRTLLTVLGVVIGSCAIVVMISLGLGSNAALDEMLSEWGDLNVVTVRAPYEGGGGGRVAVMSIGGGSSSSGNEEGEAPLDEKALESFKGIKGVSMVFPVMDYNEWGTMNIYAGKNNRYVLQSQIVGVDLKLLEKFGLVAAEGTLEGMEEEDMSSTIVLGETVPYDFVDSKKKWGYNRVYKAPKPDGTMTKPFVNVFEDKMILGISNKKGDSSGNLGLYPTGGKKYEHKVTAKAVLTANYNKFSASGYGIIMDISLLKKLIIDADKLNGVKDAKEPKYSQMMIWVDDLKLIGEVQEAVEKMGFKASSMEDARKNLQAQTAQMQMLLGGLAAVSLFVAAIGITNTMIMSIYERTREIGVMKVLGCFISNIRQVFLLEAGCIGLFGGIVGVAISYVISIILNTVGANVLGSGFVQEGGQSPVSIIPLWLVLLALAFSTIIGLVSGFYPANRAVKISALEAIKQDG